ncbi:MAG: nucleotidyltransferase substrate binding protein [Campylobacterales bacterium]|nr:nucleotidyltransferase substrate binding protein [Campylobacterales bacterium]
MNLDTSYISKCNQALKRAYQQLGKYEEDSIDYEIYRSAVIKEFEIVLEQSGKLLKKVLKPYLHTNKAVDKLVFKDIFREAGHHGLLELEEVERWLEYRDNRNSTSHDYGEHLANETLSLIKQFIEDVNRLIKVVDAS